MAMNNPYQQYQQNSIMTAPPEELILMLYNGAIKFLKQSKIYLEEKQFDKAHNNIIRSEDIIRELMCSLDMQYEISGNLFQLYDFMYNWLVQANINKTNPDGVAKVNDVIGMLEDLRDTWVETIKIVKSSQKNGA